MGGGGGVKIPNFFNSVQGTLFDWLGKNCKPVHYGKTRFKKEMLRL